jgi:hypothetical protein
MVHIVSLFAGLALALSNMGKGNIGVKGNIGKA